MCARERHVFVISIPSEEDGVARFDHRPMNIGDDYPTLPTPSKTKNIIENKVNQSTI